MEKKPCQTCKKSKTQVFITKDWFIRTFGTIIFGLACIGLYTVIMWLF